MGHRYPQKYGDSGSGGGGATSVYLKKGDIESRILVSGGGGGGYHWGRGGDAGGLVGRSGYTEFYNYPPFGGNQTDGYRKGYGQSGNTKTIYGNNGAEGNCGSGGGYWGGKTPQIDSHNSNMPGSGGSSYISGHPRCSIHSSGYIFKNTILLGGNESITLPNGEKTVGNLENGHFRLNYYGLVTENVRTTKLRVRKR